MTSLRNTVAGKWRLSAAGYVVAGYCIDSLLRHVVIKYQRPVGPTVTGLTRADRRL